VLQFEESEAAETFQFQQAIVGDSSVNDVQFLQPGQATDYGLQISVARPRVAVEIHSHHRPEEVVPKEGLEPRS